MNKWVGPIVAIALLGVIASGALLWWRWSDARSSLQLGGQSYRVTVLRTEDERQRGLSGTGSLPAGQAMLFVFPGDGKWGIWMKDMNYPIDIVWLDGSHSVVHTVKDAQPASYPDTTFRPPVNSRYVIELPSGTIERTGIARGDRAALPAGVY